MIDKWYIFIRQDARTDITEIRNRLSNISLFSIDGFDDLFCSDDNKHANDIPSDKCPCFFLRISIAAKKETQHPRDQDNKHGS